MQAPSPQHKFPRPLLPSIQSHEHRGLKTGNAVPHNTNYGLFSSGTGTACAFCSQKLALRFVAASCYLLRAELLPPEQRTGVCKLEMPATQPYPAAKRIQKILWSLFRDGHPVPVCYPQGPSPLLPTKGPCSLALFHFLLSMTLVHGHLWKRKRSDQRSTGRSPICDSGALGKQGPELYSPAPGFRDVGEESKFPSS